MNKSQSKQTLRIFWQHIKKYKLLFWLSTFSVVVGSCFNLVGPIYYKKFFDLLAANQSPLEDLIGILFIILILNVIAWFFWRVGTFAMSYHQSKVMAELYNSCFAYLHKHSVSFFNNNFVGSLVKKVNRFSRAFEGLTDTFFFEVLSLVVSIAFIMAVLWQRSLFLVAAIFVWVVIYCVINYFFSLYKLKFDLQRSQVDSEITGLLADTITNSRTVKFFNGYQRENEFFGQTTRKWQQLLLYTWNLSNKFEAVQALLMIILELGIFYLALGLWQEGKVTIGDFVLIQAYIIAIFHRLWNFGRIIRRYYEHMSDANEMTEILLTPHEIKDSHQAKELKVTAGEIVFKDIVFSYHKTRRIFYHLNLAVRPKEKIALVGSSGSGKSTLVSLLLRNYDLEGGKIMIDGLKISEVTQESLWSNVSFVSQEPILFHRSLAENIRYGKPEASEEELIKAAKLANCHEFISRLPEGFETFVGERGIKLSAGERQRVAIARAILKNAPILVLDEATSSLDSESESLIQEALENLMSGKTVLVIAHRLSTIMKMDRIVVLDEGKIVEEGNHVSLIQKGSGLYLSFWQKQVGGYIKPE